MAVSFPTFYGHHDDNARDFMDSLEMAHLMAGRDQEEVKLRAFPLVLKGEARVWYDALAPPSKATWSALYGAFLNKYGQRDTPENLWKQLLRHRQSSLGDYNTYESKFTNLWERWAASLQGQGGAPNFLKRDKFVEGMFPTLKEKVEAKFPQTFEEAQEIATVKFKKLLYQERKSNCVKEREAPISADSHQEDLLHKLTQQLETLTLNLVQAPTRGQQLRDDARPLRRSTQELRCWNCNETGHVACDESEVQVILAATTIKQPRYQGMESLAPIVSYILEGEFPQSFTKAQKQRLMEKASSYLFLEGALYQRGKDHVCRRIPTVEEIPSILEGLHEEACGGHFAQELTAKKILLSGYVWPSLHIDVQHWCKSCHNCQVNGNKHLLHGPRQLVLANGPFEKWGIDAMGPLPRTKNGKLYILVAIDYMTRWVEAQSVTRVNEKTVSNFVYTHICCKFGTPLEIVSDNGPGFRKGLLTEVCEELHILHRHSTPYYPQSNGLVEKANGIIAGIIRKMVKNKTKLWDDFLDGALWAYRTTYKEATEFTPFHLVYGQEALQPIELNIPTMRLHGKAAQRKEEEWTDRLLTLAELEWKREVAYECYKRKATQVKDKLDKEVKDKRIKEGDLVLRYDNRLDNRFDAKFETRWQGPYIVKKAFNSSYYQLMDLDGKEHPRKVNGYRLKPYLSRILPKDLQHQRQKSTLSHKSCSLVQRWTLPHNPPKSLRKKKASSQTQMPPPPPASPTAPSSPQQKAPSTEEIFAQPASQAPEVTKVPKQAPRDEEKDDKAEVHEQPKEEQNTRGVLEPHPPRPPQETVQIHLPTGEVLEPRALSSSSSRTVPVPTLIIQTDPSQEEAFEVVRNFDYTQILQILARPFQC
ncbi:hypothetical protein L7F22_016518 [Adiantum nelumboides]|nr:hypothetical protein [Adiantum nelumboides]